MKKFAWLILIVCFGANASLKVSAFNIRNFDKNGEGTNKYELENIIQGLNSDLISIEEIYNNNSFESFVNKKLPEYKLVLSRCGGGGQQNLGFIYKPQRFDLLKVDEDSRIADPGGLVPSYGCGSLRPAMIGFFHDKVTGKNLVAITVHLKAGSGSRNYAKREKQYKLLVKIIRNLRLAGHKDILVMGDFNTTGFDSKDVDYRNFSNLLSQTGTDTISKDLACTSYWSGENQHDDIEEPSTLDHIVYSQNLLGLKLAKVSTGTHCKKAKCQEVYDSVLGSSYESVSDHCPISAEFE